MARVNPSYIVCDQCGGAIPSGSGRLHIDGAELVLADGAGVSDWGELDFCCNAHMDAYIAAQPGIVPTPNPLYTAPPVQSDATD